MSSSNGTNTLMDWRDITERLLDPKLRRAIVTKADTEELNRMKTKNAFLKRKRKLLDQIRKNINYNNNNAQKPDANDDQLQDSSRHSSLCSELNFTNDDEVPSTPPPTLPPSAAILPSATNRPNHRPHPHQSTVPVTTAVYGSDYDWSTIDMGDYENRIRPSSAFWRKPDGLSLAEKIILYRNWKYRNLPKRDQTREVDLEMESTLTDNHRGRSTRRPAQSAAVLRRRNSFEEGRQRPVTVLPKMTEQVPYTFPPIDNRRQVIVTSSHGVTSSHNEEEEKLPSIEKNQYVVRRSPSQTSVKVSESNELREFGRIDRRTELIKETKIDSVVQTNKVVVIRDNNMEKVVVDTRSKTASPKVKEQRKKFLMTPPVAVQKEEKVIKKELHQETKEELKKEEERKDVTNEKEEVNEEIKSEERKTKTSEKKEVTNSEDKTQNDAEKENLSDNEKTSAKTPTPSTPAEAAKENKRTPPAPEPSSEDKPTEPVKEETPPPEESSKSEEEPLVEEKETPSDPFSKKKRVKAPREPTQRGPRPNGQPDRLIKKLDKRVEKDLRVLQGQTNEEADDDDDTDVDEDTLKDILVGERGKALDDFLKS